MLREDRVNINFSPKNPELNEPVTFSANLNYSHVSSFALSKVMIPVYCLTYLCVFLYSKALSEKAM